MALHKTSDPCTVMVYLGIILDTCLMEARLPNDKLVRIIGFLNVFLNRKSTFEVVRKVCLFLRNSSLYSHLLLETVCTVAFFGFLRCGEFTGENGQEFHPSFNLCVCDMTISADCTFEVKSIKNRLFQTGCYHQTFPDK